MTQEDYDFIEATKIENLKRKKYIKEVAELYQDECHRFISECKANGAEGSYQDLTNVFMFLQFADLSDQIMKLRMKHP